MPSSQSPQDTSPDCDFEPTYKENPEWWQRKAYRERITAERENPKFDPDVNEQLLQPLSFEEYRGEPGINDTIGLLSNGQQSIGSLMISERIEDGYDTPADAVFQWIDEGSMYCIRKRAEPRTERTAEGESDKTRMTKRYRSGVWTLSPNVVCKVMWWTEGSTTDAETLKWVNEKIPSLPTADYMYDWVDIKWHRSFLLTRRAAGTRFDEAWPKLTRDQRINVAQQLATYCKLLAEFTSDYLETVTGRGVEGKHCLRPRNQLPEWKPRVESRVTREQYRQWLTRKEKHEPPDFGGPFVLWHPDLNPTNFFVTIPKTPEESPQLTAIIDWSNVGYYPKYFAATRPREQSHYAIEPPMEFFTHMDGGEFSESYIHWDGFDWMWMLSNALYKEGFPLETENWRERWGDWLRHINQRELPIGH